MDPESRCRSLELERPLPPSKLLEDRWEEDADDSVDFEEDDLWCVMSLTLFDDVLEGFEYRDADRYSCVDPYLGGKKNEKFLM